MVRALVLNIRQAEGGAVQCYKRGQSLRGTGCFTKSLCRSSSRARNGTVDIRITSQSFEEFFPSEAVSFAASCGFMLLPVYWSLQAVGQRLISREAAEILRKSWHMKCIDVLIRGL